VGGWAFGAGHGGKVSAFSSTTHWLRWSREPQPISGSGESRNNRRQKNLSKTQIREKIRLQQHLMEDFMENQNNKKHIWEGSVGVCIDQRQNSETGESFFTFEPVRCFKRDGNDNFEYSHSFTEKNAEALGIVLSTALSYIQTQPHGM